MSKISFLKIVQDFILSENKPCSLNEVLEKCCKDIGKANAQKALDSLVSKDILVEKTHGKHKIYFAKQTSNLAEQKGDIKLLRQKVSQSQTELKSKEAQLNELNEQLKTLQKAKSLDILKEERDKLLEDVKLLNEKLKSYQAQKVQVQYSTHDINKIKEKYKHISIAYRKRKRMCNDMLEALMEGYPKTKKSLVADIGLETDEEVGFSLKL